MIEYALKRCKCGGKPKMIEKIPKKHEICYVQCKKCGKRTQVCMAAHMAAMHWNVLCAENHYEKG